MVSTFLKILSYHFRLKSEDLFFCSFLFWGGQKTLISGKRSFLLDGIQYEKQFPMSKFLAEVSY